MDELATNFNAGYSICLPQITCKVLCEELGYISILASAITLRTNKGYKAKSISYSYRAIARCPKDKRNRRIQKWSKKPYTCCSNISMRTHHENVRKEKKIIYHLPNRLSLALILNDSQIGNHLSPQWVKVHLACRWTIILNLRTISRQVPADHTKHMLKNPGPHLLKGNKSLRSCHLWIPYIVYGGHFGR